MHQSVYNIYTVWCILIMNIYLYIITIFIIVIIINNNFHFHFLKKVNVLEMKCLRSLVGVSRMDRVRNEEVRRRPGIEG